MGNVNKSESHSEVEEANSTATRKGMTRYSDLLIKAGADVNKRNRRDLDALYYSVQNSDDTFMEILLKAGADVNIGYGPFQNRLLNLVSAPYSNWTDKVKHLKFVTMLIKAGTDVNAVTGNGETSCHYAAAFGCIGWKQELLLTNAKCMANQL